MAYIYKKTIGNKAYYYLRASKKTGNKLITKDIAYLGNNIEDVRNKLNKLPKYKYAIRKAYRTINNFIESNIYKEKVLALNLKKDFYLEYNDLIDAEACKLHFNKVFNKYDDVTKKEIFKNFIVEFTFNTTSIEGNTISLKETRNLLIENLTPKNKSLREIYDIQNTENVFFNVLDIKQDLSNDFIESVHKGLMANIDSRWGYRTRDVIVIKSNFKATPAPYVKTDMNILLKWYDANKTRLHPLALATIFHHKFEKIHPFMDGNGRTGRILLNFILIKNKFPPVIIYKKNRFNYLEALKKADRCGLTELNKDYYSNLNSFISNELNESYWNIFL